MVMQMADKKEVLKEKPEVENAVNIAKVRSISKKQKKAHKPRMLAWVIALCLVIIVLFILSKASVLKSPPIDQTFFPSAPANETELVQATALQESSLSYYSDRDFGISFSYPEEFILGAYIGKDISLAPPLTPGSIQTYVKITKTPLAKTNTLYDYTRGTQISFGLVQYKPQNITLSDGTAATLINVEINRAVNPKGAYLLIFVKQDWGYYMYYFAPIPEFRKNLPEVEQIADTVKLVE